MSLTQKCQVPRVGKQNYPRPESWKIKKEIKSDNKSDARWFWPVAMQLCDRQESSADSSRVYKT